MATKEEALHRLIPNTEWVWKGEDIDGLTILTEGVNKPTQSQINKAIKDIEAEEQFKANKLAANRASAIAKLAAIGLTEDEAKALLG